MLSLKIFISDFFRSQSEHNAVVGADNDFTVFAVAADILQAASDRFTPYYASDIILTLKTNI